MSFISWLRGLDIQSAHAGRGRKQNLTRRSRRPVSRKLSLEPLESRLTPSASLDWAQAIGTAPAQPGYSTCRAGAVDGAGNVYMTGSFADVAGAGVDFDPSSLGVHNLYSAGDTVAPPPGRLGPPDIYVASYSPTGAFRWAVGMGGLNIDTGYAIAVDSTGSNVFVGGLFIGTATFGSFTVNGPTSGGGFSGGGFVTKLDAATGSISWVNGDPWAVGSTTPNSQVEDIAADASGNCYAIGLSGMTKLDAGGHRVFGTQIGGTAIEVAGGNIYTAGSFSGSVDFDPGPGTFKLSNGNGSGVGDAGYVEKFTAGGGFVWARAFLPQKSSKGMNDAAPSGLAVDGAGNVYVGGGFSGKVDFDPGSGSTTLVSTLAAGSTVINSSDAFVAKLNSAGNFVWAKQFGGSGDDAITGLALDSAGSVYLAGFYYATVDFDPGAGIYNLTSAGAADAFVLKLDTGGNFQWAASAGGSILDHAFDVAVDNTGNVFVLGRMNSNTLLVGLPGYAVDFDPTAGVFNVITDDEAAYVWKLKQL